MSIGSAMASYEAYYKARLQEATFGHLFPEKTTEPVRGQVRFAKSVYGDLVVLDEDITIPSSPWWKQALDDYMGSIEKVIDPGQVIELLVDVIVRTDIHEIPWMSEIELYLEEGWNDDVVEYSKIKYSERIEIKEVEANLVLESLT